jgi:hypothetical protein
VVLSDAPIPPDSTEAVDQQAYWGINITHIEQALSHLLGEGQEVSEGGVLTSPSWLGPIPRAPSTHSVSSHTLFPVSQCVQTHPVSSLTVCPVCPSHCDRVCACQVCAAVPVLCVLTGCGDFSAARVAPAQAAGSSPT